MLFSLSYKKIIDKVKYDVYIGTTPSLKCINFKITNYEKIYDYSKFLKLGLNNKIFNELKDDSLLVAIQEKIGIENVPDYLKKLMILQ